MDRPARCVLCHTRPVDPKWRPFCSRRCQATDQARWATETYRVPGPGPQCGSRIGDPGPPADVPEDEADNQDDG